ncbi:alpha/beta-hydrolase [Aspergillus steynii IBT 23096]|uniref:Alpha/beta-hydrolase n=1 Tax=Aspergillus steynii IBT 23096 TaxID=1392250 RepID=A0A2I2FX41_9EURO|nr:alpha/beta-hydrolase [Aspergillus steynii IBT 23096]PLB45209.1 alpha/beta-hydrolase [Aspergillus steynii IBT 23096]
MVASPSPRWWLLVQAIFWRCCMRLGMFIHDLGPPRPPRRSFIRTIPVGDSHVDLYFYCPEGYSQGRKEGRRWPVVVNFHGGGFTLGCATDDGRWCRSVLDEVGAVVVSVGYRRAPEHPFPAAVDDGVRALEYLASHAPELAVDVSRIVLSGFSAGGNLAVTVPLRLRSLMSQAVVNPALDRAESTDQLVDSSATDINIVGLFCWYPILDFEESRDHRRAMSIMPNKTLPAFFTDLFDESYLPDLAERRSPFASPVRAEDEMLAESLPHDIFLYICEWDMLLKEGQHFVRRLQAINKHVRAMMIEKAPHAWDKSPNPFRDQDKVDILYRDACADMKAIFNA